MRSGKDRVPLPHSCIKLARIFLKPRWGKAYAVIALFLWFPPRVLSCRSLAGGHPVFTDPHGCQPSWAWQPNSKETFCNVRVKIKESKCEFKDDGCYFIGWLSALSDFRNEGRFRADIYHKTRGRKKGVSAKKRSPLKLHIDFCLVISVLSIVPARISEKACAIGRLLIEGRELGERG